jgi:hypothetical protein
MEIVTASLTPSGTETAETNVPTEGRWFEVTKTIVAQVWVTEEDVYKGFLHSPAMMNARLVSPQTQVKISFQTKEMK